MKDSPQKPQLKKGKPVSMDKKNEETVAVEKAEESSTAQVSDSRQAGASERDADTKDSQVAGLLAEATHLLRSMRPSLKAVKLSSLEKGDGHRALLDGGATHALRMPKSQLEYDEAVPIRVELASGETVLRQVVETGTLLTDVPTLKPLFLWGSLWSWDMQWNGAVKVFIFVHLTVKKWKHILMEIVQLLTLKLD